MLSEKKVFKDNVLGYIEVTDELIWDLIDTREFQRLRRIRHLGGVSYVFHSAEHSRFSHSLGVYEITRRFINAVEGISLDDYEKRVLLCSALLHDLGHGPLSHAFESVSAVNHELISERIVRGKTEVNQVLCRYNKSLVNDIANVLNKTHENELITSIISSQIDADRLDYLLRDSYNTGVVYGINDLERLFRTAKVINNTICFKKSALKELEIYLLSRICMYDKVYFHPTGRSYEIIFQNAIVRYFDLKNQGFKFTHSYELLDVACDSSIELNQFHMLDDHSITHYMKMFMLENDDILSDLSERFLNRHLFEFIEYYDEGKIVDLHSQAQEILKENGFNPKYYLATDTQSTSLYKRSEEILICDMGKVVKIEEVSDILNHINNEEAATYLFFPREVYDIISKLY